MPRPLQQQLINRTFNSLYLGFSLASKSYIVMLSQNAVKSFNSLYLGFSLASEALLELKSQRAMYFQFPLLGIFPCIRNWHKPTHVCYWRLSIPFTWDFPLHHVLLLLQKNQKEVSFNSLYLGFSLASSKKRRQRQASLKPFNSLYLGFSLASENIKLCTEALKVTFNSLYLGFSLASACFYQQAQQIESLSIPFTWDFPLHLRGT